MPKKNKNKSVVVSAQKLAELQSRPKQSTLARDKRQGVIRKGKGYSNPYLHTLQDPVRVTGVKVPDVTSFPTSTFQTYFLAEITIGAGGFQGMTFQPIPQDFAASLNTSGGSWNSWTGQGDYASINAAIHSLRPVSGLVRVTTTASSTNNQGEVIGLLCPPEQDLSVINTMSLGSNRFSAYRTPLKNGMEYLWMPLDPKSRQFTLSGDAASDGVINSLYPGIVALVGGAAAGTIVRFETFFNWEAVPEDATWNLLNATAPYVSTKDLENATASMSTLGSFGRRYGEDIGSWLLDQGAVFASSIGPHLARGAAHYVSAKMGLRGGPNSPVYVM